MAPAVAIVGDPEGANGQALLELAHDLAGRAAFLVGNSISAFEAFVANYDVDIIVFAAFAGGNPGVIAELWPKCPKVRWVHSLAAGVDTLVPVLLALPGGPEMPLTNAKGAFSRSLAEYALAAMLHFNKQVPRLQQNRATRTWDRFIMSELFGQTVGFVGFGDIAQSTAVLCKAFGMRIIALRNSRGQSGDELADSVFYSSEDTEPGAGRREVFRQADHIICSLPGTPSTKHACGREEFAAMKPTGVFVSIGRGLCVDEAALAEVLKAKRIAGAALDVFEKEPLPLDSPLWDCETLLFSAHNADLTAQYMRLTWDLFIAKLTEYSAEGFAGFASLVDKTKGY